MGAGVGLTSGERGGALALGRRSQESPRLVPLVRFRPRAADQKSPPIPSAPLVAAVALEPATFGSQNRPSGKARSALGEGIGWPH